MKWVFLEASPGVGHAPPDFQLSTPNFLAPGTCGGGVRQLLMFAVLFLKPIQPIFGTDSGLLRDHLESPLKHPFRRFRVQSPHSFWSKRRGHDVGAADVDAAPVSGGWTFPHQIVRPLPLGRATIVRRCPEPDIARPVRGIISNRQRIRRKAH